ncbi:uncharacterized protein LOC110460056 [Mizuhopecten yessoensis]|uniref:uncharacterized protein LOC110460056 n=1 Tax=Mizuhopecten yessoensis TaxID=6573 RepID=UPI000B45E266|nr:uncharacterized protein LOC110460056 [Mizuhopecten yessoensis]
MSGSSDSSSSNSEDSYYTFLDFYQHSESRRGEDGQDSHDNGVEPGLPDTVSIESLKDLAARETSKYWGCAELECTNLSLDDHLLERICAKASPVDQKKLKSCATLCSKSYRYLWDHAECLVKAGSVKECRQIGFLLAAQVARLETSPRKAQEHASVSVKFEKQRITYVSCSKCLSEFWCEHILAAILYRARFPEKVRTRFISFQSDISTNVLPTILPENASSQS